MRRIIERIKRMFRRSERYYVLIAASKFSQEDIGQETYVAGYLFDTYEDALRHKMDVESHNESVVVLGIETIKTKLDVTYARLNYKREPGHPNPSVVFKRRK